MNVAPSSGTPVWLTTSFAAVMASMPCFIFMRMPSVTTMALSTSMPRAITRAPSEIRSRVIVNIPMKRKVPMMVTTNTKPIIRLLRNPIKIISTAITMATAWPRLIRKPSMAAVTATGCMAIVWSSMPSGVWLFNSASFLVIASPITTTLPPGIVEMAIPTAGWPS